MDESLDEFQKHLHGRRLSKKAKNKKFHKDAMLMSLVEVILVGMRHWLKYQNGTTGWLV